MALKGKVSSRASTSLRYGSDSCAPARVTAMPEAQMANSTASCSVLPSANATATAALKQSPAAVVSTARTCFAGNQATCPFRKTPQPFSPSVTITVPTPLSRSLRAPSCMACPSQVDKIREVSALEGTVIDQVFIGSCTNGRLEDLEAAAKVLEGKKTAPFVKLIVTPASRKVYQEADARGILRTLAEAGAIITHPGCGLCCGRTGGILWDGERVVATNNRNFLGRMGTSKVEIYLASPVTAAACAVAGKIVLPS